MKREVIIRPEAEEDIRNAFTWYECRMTGLGHRFLTQVDAGMRFIVQYPEIFRIEYQDTRKYLLKRFPFKIIYLVEPGKIVVLGVIHEKRSMDYTIDRVNNA